MTDSQPPTPRSKRIYVYRGVALGLLVTAGSVPFYMESSNGKSRYNERGTERRKKT